MLRVVKEVRPHWVLGENVVGIISMALDNVLSDLESEGYKTAAFVIPACAVGTPHRRDRVWILAHAESEKDRWIQRSRFRPDTGADGEDVAHAQDIGRGSRRAEPAGFGGELCTAGGGGPCEDVAHACGKRLPGSEQKQEYAGSIAKRGKRHPQPGLGVLSDGLSSRLAEHRWPAPAGCDQYHWEPPRLAAGKAPFRRQKLQALGNAVVPQVVREIGMAILAAEGMIPWTP